MTSESVPKPIGVIAADGFGSRLLPATKTISKDMITVVNQPIMHYVIRDFVRAGITDLVIVTSRHDVTKHFVESPDEALVQYLTDKDKKPELEELHAITSQANIITMAQDKKLPYGNARPLISAYNHGLLAGRSSVAFAFADDWVEATPSRFTQLYELQQDLGGSVITLVHRDHPKDYRSNAFAEGEQLRDGVLSMHRLTEKPGTAASVNGSVHASVGGYMIEPGVLPYIAAQQELLRPGQEFAIQAGIQAAMNDGHVFHGLHIENGTFFDAGDKLGLIKSNVAVGLGQHPDIRAELEQYILDTADRIRTEQQQ